MAERDVISTLNTLIETCRDGEEGFRKAAENVKDGSIKSIFNEIGRERAQLADELAQEVQRLGGTPESGGSVSGAMHRGWMNVKETLAGRDDTSIVAEAERGEDVAVETYKKALEQPLPPPVESIVRRQFSHVQEAHDRVRALEESGPRST
jgi:uncharacterized protein (TIGR02284 family)